MSTKTCNKCEAIKPVVEFNRDRAARMDRVTTVSHVIVVWLKTVTQEI